MVIIYSDKQLQQHFIPKILVAKALYERVEMCDKNIELYGHEYGKEFIKVLQEKKSVLLGVAKELGLKNPKG